MGEIGGQKGHQYRGLQQKMKGVIVRPPVAETGRFPATRIRREWQALPVVTESVYSITARTSKARAYNAFIQSR